MVEVLLVTYILPIYFKICGYWQARACFVVMGKCLPDLWLWVHNGFMVMGNHRPAL